MNPLARVLLCIGVTGAVAAETPRDLSPKSSAIGALTSADVSIAVAGARAQEMESLTRLTAEGEALYQADSNKKTGYQYCSIASRLSEQGEFRRSIREATKALFLGLKAGNDDVLAHAKRDLAIAYSYSGNLDKAEEYAGQSLKHYVDPRRRDAVYGRDYKVLGDVAMRRGDPAKAILMYLKSVDVADDDLRFYSRASLVTAYAAAGQMDKAGEMLAKADSYVDTLGELSKGAAKAALFRITANMALREGKFEAAAKMFESAVVAGGQAARSDEPYERFWAHEGIARAKQAKGDKAGALAAYLEAIADSEQVRARFRSDEIKTGLFGQMQRVFDEAVNLLMESGRVDAAWEISEQGRARALIDMVRNRVALSSGANVFADPLAGTSKPAELSALLKNGDVVVEYHVTDSRTHVWLIRTAGMTGLTLNVGRVQLTRQVAEFRAALGERKSGSIELGARLYDALLGPLGVKPTESLVIVPHDALHYLPFQALRAGNGFLVEHTPVSYVPSGSTLAAVIQRGAAKQGRLLALANPDFGEPMLALPGAQVEVEHIQAFFPENEAYFRHDATKLRLTQGAGRSRMVHIAAHAETDPLDPLFSRIYLAGNSRAAGALEAHEIYGMSLQKAALVALSACETGLGTVSRGDEIWGFTRSFLSAGSSAVLVSLWPVSDEATEMLMTSFYRGLATVEARQALRLAQIEVMKDPRFSHPYFWAAFNLVGDWR